MSSNVHLKPATTVPLNSQIISCHIFQGEIIQLHVGQAGVQIANACWELYCLEHGIDSNGYMYHWPSDEAFRTFFACCDTPKLVPRVVMVDSEPTVIDEVRTGAYGQLFKPDSLINGKEDSGSNFARGYNTLGSELIDITMDSIRSIAEDCPNLKGFIAFRSMGGGTGSGLGDRIMERISDEYGKITKMDFIIFPSPSISPLIMEPYNSLLGAHVGMDSSDCAFILDNEALYDICAKSLDVSSPTYTNLNRIIGQAISALTAPQRFYGSMNVSFAEFQTNLVPYPRIHFPLVSYAPLATLCTACYTQLSTEQLTFQCFHPSSQLVRCNPVKGKYMSCVLLYRGNVVPADINSSIQLMKAKSGIRFVDWCPTGFKIGINSMPPCPVPGGDVGHTNRALVALANSTAIQVAWCRLLNKFDHLYKRRAFVHHFVSEGMEEDMFAEASDDICSLIGDYRAAEGELDTSDRSGSMQGVPWRQQFRMHRDQAEERSYDSEETARSRTGKRVHASYSDCSSYAPEIRNPPRFQVSSARLSTSGDAETGDRVSDSQMNENRVTLKIVEGQEREKSCADKIDSPMPSAEETTPSQIDLHFQIHSDVGSTARVDHPRSQSTEVRNRCSTSDFYIQIRNGVCRVFDNISKSTAAASKAATTINCVLNVTQRTCTSTADLSTEVPTFSRGELSKSYPIKIEKNRLPSMIPIPIAKRRYSTSQNCQSKKHGQVGTSGEDGIIPRTERTGLVDDHASLKLQRSSKLGTGQRKFNDANSISKPRRFLRSVRSRKFCQTIPHIKRKVAPISNDRIDFRRTFNDGRIPAPKPRRFITRLVRTGSSSA